MGKGGGPPKSPNAGKYPAPFSLRLSEEERAALDRLARGQPWATYIKSVVFSDLRPPIRTKGHVIQDRKLFAQLLGLLGQSRLSQNVNQLAKASNSGSLPVTPETEKEIKEAAAAIRRMRSLLIEAMGLKDQGCDDAGNAP
ncbi:MAG: hypothetical protein JAZ11_00110 [Candidatus Thiodiazotropha lotti]|nr:hypothetical protein [Candidatus Thiodiazotropha lotti]